jgi:hypothetical protein
VNTYKNYTDPVKPLILADSKGFNFGVFGLCPSSGIVETRKLNISETGSVSILR